MERILDQDTPEKMKTQDIEDVFDSLEEGL